MRLPHQSPLLYLLTGSLETTLLYDCGIDFPSFASFTLLRRPEAVEPMRSFFLTGAALAQELGCGIVFSTPTWRASEDWGRKLGYSRSDLAEIIKESVHFVEEIRTSQPDTQIVISGCMGPRGDGYVLDSPMTAAAAEEYHSAQVSAFTGTSVDMLSAMTLNYSEEAIGIAKAAKRASLPVVISFTVETDGLLPSGESLETAIAATDSATECYPIYYMINCSHPSHFEGVLDPAQEWVARVRGLQVNASSKSHEQLTASIELDPGDPPALAASLRELSQRLPHLCALGGCCGTDFRHIRLIAEQCTPVFAAR